MFGFTCTSSPCSSFDSRSQLSVQEKGTGAEQKRSRAILAPDFAGSGIRCREELDSDFSRAYQPPALLNKTDHMIAKPGPHVLTFLQPFPNQPGGLVGQASP
jgi:hypothetical protein